MGIQENGRQDGFGTFGHGCRDSFLEHNRRMRVFRESHPAWTETGPARLAMTAAYRAGRTLTETGGSVGPVDEDYLMMLVPMQEVTARRLVAN